jgi:hypothetical protein
MQLPEKYRENFDVSSEEEDYVTKNMWTVKMLNYISNDTPTYRENPQLMIQAHFMGRYTWIMN